MNPPVSQPQATASSPSTRTASHADENGRTIERRAAGHAACPAACAHGLPARSAGELPHQPTAGWPSAGRGSWLLASSLQRMAAALLASGMLWALTAWAMGWL